MSKKQIGVYGLVLAVLAVLVYLQFRTWKNFDWATFWDQGRHLSLLHILRAVCLIYFTYILRALRWKIFLRPVRPQASLAGTDSLRPSSASPAWLCSDGRESWFVPI